MLTLTQGAGQSKETVNMKIECPVCGIVGYVEKRGNSVRIKHYEGMQDNTRKYVIHSLSRDQFSLLGIDSNCEEEHSDFIGNKWESTVGINNLKSSLIKENIGGRSLAWLGHRLPKPTTRVQIPVTALISKNEMRIFEF